MACVSSVRRGTTWGVSMPSKPCKKAGCAVLVRDGSGYCAEHQQVKQDREAAANATDPFYCTARWQRLRNYKRKVNPLCEPCLVKGIVKGVQMVDHTIPIKKGGRPLDLSNLKSMCNECHATKTANDKMR